MSVKTVLAMSLSGLLFACGCGCGRVTPPLVNGDPARNAYIATDDPLGELVAKVVYLNQNWTPGESLRFYSTPQGSQLLPYDWFLALEQADSTTLFRENKNILKYRYLPRNAGPENPDGLPVGFVKEDGGDRIWLGFSCAACHTNEIRLGTTGYRIDGAPTGADAQGFLGDLANALDRTMNDPAKLDRFSAKVFPGGDKAKLKDELGTMFKIRSGYNLRNFLGYDPKATSPQLLTNYGRLDAVDSIVNEAFWRTVKNPDLDHPTVVAKPCNARVSYPFLWDTPQHVAVEWLGIASNGKLGDSIEGIRGDFSGLTRNVGEVLGVFGRFTIGDDPTSLLNFGYNSTVKFTELIQLNQQLKTLWSPEWPTDFPAIDRTAAALGAKLYAQPSRPGVKDSCLDCHAIIDRKTLDRTKISIDAKTWAVGTDGQASDNFFKTVRSSGKLAGHNFYDQPVIDPESHANPVLTNVVTGVLLGFYKSAPPDPLKATGVEAERVRVTSLTVPGAAYKARPLDGIWATAPYLHNGSVPTLDDLLKPSGERPKSFNVGVRTFDPVKVGFLTDVANFPKFNVLNPDGTPILGNSNGGHDYGTQLSSAERIQLIEYLKSL